MHRLNNDIALKDVFEVVDLLHEEGYLNNVPSTRLWDTIRLYMDGRVTIYAFSELVGAWNGGERVERNATEDIRKYYMKKFNAED